jgi:hypothetical protein
MAIYNITVDLVGSDGNAFSVLGKVSKEMRKHGLKQEDINKFYDEATNGDYDHLLQTVMKYVNVE